MIDVTCKVQVIEVDGNAPVEGVAFKPLVVQSYTKSCGAGQYVTLRWRGHSITVHAGDLNVAAANAARTSGDSDEIPF